HNPAGAPRTAEPVLAANANSATSTSSSLRAPSAPANEMLFCGSCPASDGNGIHQPSPAVCSAPLFCSIVVEANAFLRYSRNHQCKLPVSVQPRPDGSIGGDADERPRIPTCVEVTP
ncbi:MAG: hypothetical protein JXR83_18425, partial [Deltaproteobacteria bacterium]|nr:hypothetical protein [Deltaproteobacteria bacterium]